MDSSNTTSIFFLSRHLGWSNKGNNWKFLPIQSLASLHILTPLANKGKFFFPEGIYVPFSSEFNAGNPLITKGLPNNGSLQPSTHLPGSVFSCPVSVQPMASRCFLQSESDVWERDKCYHVFAVDALYVSSDSSASIVWTKSFPPLPRRDFGSILKLGFLEAEQIVRAR